MKASIFKDHRQYLLPIAYNMLGDRQDAEDMVQDTLLKWLSVDKSDLKNERAYLVRILINKCLNFIRDRKRRQEETEGFGENGPIFMPALFDQARAINLGIQAILEKLTPYERAVFILKELLDFSHREIAEMLDISEANSRQLLSRARRHLHQDRQRFDAHPERQLELYNRFIEACRGEDLQALIELLKEDIALESDRPAAALQPVDLALEILRKSKDPDIEMSLRWLKGRPAIVVYLKDQPLEVWHIRSDKPGTSTLRIIRTAPPEVLSQN